MINPEQIPDAVWRALGKELGFIQHRDAYCKAIATALSAWPGVQNNGRAIWGATRGPAIILPLTEASDDK